MNLFWVIQKTRRRNPVKGRIFGPVVRGGTLIAAMERRGSLFVFSFGNDVLPLALGAFHGKSHTTVQRENINHQTATAIAAESLLGIGILVLHKANILMKK